MKTSNLKLGELLLYSGKITKEQLNKALNRQGESNEKIGEILVNEGYVSKNDIIEILEFQLGIPHVDLDKFIINPEVVFEIPENIARRYDLIAIDIRGNMLMVAMADPLNIFAIDDMKLYTNYEIQPVISDKDSIRNNLDKYYRKEVTEKVLEEFTKTYNYKDFNDLEDEELLEVSAAPVVKLINSIIEQAVEMRASDIHIEPWDSDIKIRFRIDGDLTEIMKLSINSLSALVTRIKIMGRMDIAEKRIPQDGRVEAKVNGKEIDMRISSIPTVYGEKIVLRLLDRSNFMFTKTELGFKEENLKIFDKILQQPYGMILVTGPTGSGTKLRYFNISSKYFNPN
ncbi:GspE/PulE family protein [Clostridium sp. Cult1]|uniref:GspE/PulE family protein n=1 Tax=Clostridium sp. Cult1 TaxID=2079002 RepID=UPI001F3ACD25|nr:ATPase, T2SS/T4P/T4SS family [Clostridium sp. Cult1]